MPIYLFTDFGGSDIYAGQVRAALLKGAPRQPVIDLLHDAPAFEVKASAHLLAALVMRIPAGAVVLGVVDPGVGGARDSVVVRADGKWLVGPDNGLLSVSASRAVHSEVYTIGWRPKELSASFHGRDLFAPVAAMLARGNRRAAKLRRSSFATNLGPQDIDEVIYVDHYGNVMTGLRAVKLNSSDVVRVNGKSIRHAGVFSEVPRGELFWYENSLGLVEIASNAASARTILGMAVGDLLG